MPFFCSICSEESTRICVRCTKDTCTNHICDKCGRCSDCCECEITLAEHAPPAVSARSVFPKPEHAAVIVDVTEEDVFPEPEPEDEPLPEPIPQEPPAPEPDPVLETAEAGDDALEGRLDHRREGFGE